MSSNIKNMIGKRLGSMLGDGVLNDPDPYCIYHISDELIADIIRISNIEGITRNNDLIELNNAVNKKLFLLDEGVEFDWDTFEGRSLKNYVIIPYEYFEFDDNDSLLGFIDLNKKL